MIVEPVERIRMALAEVGYHGIRVEAAGNSWRTPKGAIPGDVRWRAREVALFGDAMCLACWSRAQYVVPTGSPPVERRPPECYAARRLVGDCGRPR